MPCSRWRQECLDASPSSVSSDPGSEHASTGPRSISLIWCKPPTYDAGRFLELRAAVVAEHGPDTWSDELLDELGVHHKAAVDAHVTAGDMKWMIDSAERVSEQKALWALT